MSTITIQILLAACLTVAVFSIGENKPMAIYNYETHGDEVLTRYEQSALDSSGGDNRVFIEHIAVHHYCQGEVLTPREWSIVAAYKYADDARTLAGLASMLCD